MYKDLLKKYNDLEAKFQELVLVVEAQAKLIVRLQVENQALKVENQALKTENLALKARIKELEVKKNSTNSHLPPSMDLGRIKKNQSLREKSGRSIGGQKGHSGTTLEMRTQVDEVETLRKSNCTRCGLSLETIEGEVVARRQVLDLPPIALFCKEYRQERLVCSCGHCNEETFPIGVENHIQYGANITSLVVYQNVYQYMPYQRLQKFFNQVFGISISPGTFENMIKRMANKAAPVYELFRLMVEQAPQVGSDETGGGKVNGKKLWFWTWQNVMVTYIVSSFSRGKDVIDLHFPKGFLNAILNSDRWSAQVSTIAKGHQLCLAHLLRDLVFLIQLESLPWAEDFKKLLLDAIKLKQQRLSYDVNDARVVEIENRLEQLLLENQNWECGEGGAKTATFIKSIRKHRKKMLTFLYDPLVPFDNNGSERAVRNIKVKLKISGCFKSYQQNFAVLRSLVDTTIKNKGDVFNVLKQLFNTQPLAAV
jgi:transposase